MDKQELIETIFLDSYFCKENKERDYEHYVKALSPQDGIGFFGTFRVKLNKTAALVVGVHIDVSKPEFNTQYRITYVDSGQQPKTRYRKWLTITFFRKREHFNGLGVDEIIRRVSPILAEKVIKAENLYNGK